MRRAILVVLLLLGVWYAYGTETLFLGPTHLRVSEEGEFSWVAPQPKKETFDNFWAYRYYPIEKKLTGLGVKVAVADSGISSHPEFNGKHIAGQDFTLSGSLEQKVHTEIAPCRTETETVYQTRSVAVAYRHDVVLGDDEAGFLLRSLGDGLRFLGFNTCAGQLFRPIVRGDACVAQHG